MTTQYHQPGLATSGSEVLDLLFDQEEGLLTSEVKLTPKVNMPQETVFTLVRNCPAW